MKGSDFIFNCVHVLYYKCNKINPNRELNKAEINPINKEDNKCFQKSVTVPLNDEEIKKDPQIITKVKAFISKYNWKGINNSQKKKR